MSRLPAAAGIQYLENGLLDVTPTGAYIAITENNATQSRLLQLPAEIRIQIFEKVMGGHTVRPIMSQYHIQSEDMRKPNKHRFSLLQVSRQVYNDTAILVYTLSTFSLRAIVDLSAWLHCMSPGQLPRIRIVRKVKIGCWVEIEL